MEIMHERVAGLDVHKATIVACVRLGAGRKVRRECRTFETTTDGLLALLAWLVECRCSHVAMEATGVYWMPVWKILSEGDFALIVANAAHIKNVPGRKTDFNDAMWIADLLACGLIKASFVPEEDMQELRSLLRTRKQLIREQTRHVQRIQKTLAEANIKLDSVLSDIMGASGRRIIEAMIEGVRQPRKLADLASKQIKATPKELYDALHGRLTDHHRFLLKLHLKQWDRLGGDDPGNRSGSRGADRTHGQGDQGRRGPVSRFDRASVHDTGGEHIVGDDDLIGNRSRHEPVPDRRAPRRLGRPVPRPERERRKRKSARLRKGAPWLKTMLVQCAWAAKRKKDSYYKAQFFRLQSRRGPQKAICAVAASILTAIYHIVKDGPEHQDLGADHFNRRSGEAADQASGRPAHQTWLRGPTSAQR